MIVRLNGGLGNQLFQYAFGKSVAKDRNEEVFFHKVNLDNGQHRAYGLGAFDTEVEFVEDVGSAPVYGEPVFKFDPGVYDAPEGSYFVGNWQTEKYFSERIVRSHFELSDKTLLEFSSESIAVDGMIVETPSCSVHVRRTDYLVPSTAAYHGVMGMDYYHRAMETIRSAEPHVTFYIFSDDPEWCRHNFPGCVIVDHNKMGNGADGPGREHEDLYLMSACNHAIIPNSSFGWWGAWLGDYHREGRIVIAPKKWFVADICSDDIVPDRWLKI